MTDIQRYSQRDISELEFPGAEDEGFDSIEFVLYSAHVEALRQAEEETLRFGSYKYEQGQRDALAGAVQRVKSLLTDYERANGIDVTTLDMREVIAAIKGEQ